MDRFYKIVEANSKAIESIIITGDIRLSGGVDYFQANAIIQKIAAAANIDDLSKINIVPGNHDLKREDTTIAIARDARRNYDYENGTFNNPSDTLPKLNSRFDDFFWPLTDLVYGSANPWDKRNIEPHYSLYFDDAGFIFLNSSLCCLQRSEDGNLIVGMAYIGKLLERSKNHGIKHVYLVAHHPVQNLHEAEEAALARLCYKYREEMNFYWLCGDAHNDRFSKRDYIKTYQVGSLTKYEEVIPDFAIYDIENGQIAGIPRRFRYLPHLNPNSSCPGGWKRVYE